MYVTISDDIRITVTSHHVSENSCPQDDIFVFSYTVTIENMSYDRIQLLERHWLITSGIKQMAEVIGPGVVGEQPVLEGGEVFEYTSGAVIRDPSGFMEGSYTFRSDKGSYFEVPVPKFDLLYPLVVH